MGTLHGPVVCPTVRSKQVGACILPPVNSSFMKARTFRSGFWGLKGRCRDAVNMRTFFHWSHLEKFWTIQCSFSSSNGNGSMAGNFNLNDEEYVNSSVVEAVEVKSGPEGFMIKMRDGKHLRCVHNNPQGGHLPDYAPHPAIVLKMEDGSDLLLPIIVLEMPSVLLMAAIRNVQIARPTLYHVVKEMIEKMGYVVCVCTIPSSLSPSWCDYLLKVKLVRITKRVHEAYFAQLYLTKVGEGTQCVSFDLRPSDAINIAVQCQVPIQVNKYLASSDGMKIIEPAKLAAQPPLSDGFFLTELDRPDGQLSVETKEFDLLRNMLVAAVEERYRDAVLRSGSSFYGASKQEIAPNLDPNPVSAHVAHAHFHQHSADKPAQWRDKLTQLRSRKRNWT